jgi:hemolysin activation/secretion protein
MKKYFLLALTICISAQAEYELKYYDVRKANESDYEVKPQQKNSIAEKRVILPSVKGIIISPEGDKPSSYVMKTTKGAQIYRVMQGISQKKRDKLQKLIDENYVGKALTLEKITELKNDVTDFYQKNGQALVIVNVPEQDVSDGVVVVTVLEARLGKVQVTGNKFFTSDWYEGNLTLSEDETILTGVVDSDVAYINTSPWRRATAIYKPGAKYGTTDVELFVEDHRPARIFVGVDNTGFKATNYNRLFVGFNLGHFFNYDQNLAFQYTASPNFKKFQAYTVYYQAPLPTRDQIILFGGYSSVDVNRSDYLPTARNHGSDWQASARYGVFIPPASNFNQSAKAGFDIKETNNDLTVSNINYISSSYAMIFQLVGEYEASYRTKRQTFDFNGEAVVQPWHFGQSMSEYNYATLRPDAVNQYLYVRMKAEYDWKDPDTGMGFMVKGRAQFSTGALLPLETFGMGGVNSVRGYVERVVNVDNGFIFNFEFRTPHVSPSLKKINDDFYAVAFFDMGAGGIFKSLPSQPGSYFLAGVGPGLRYDISNVIRARFDVGFRLTDVPFASSTKSLVEYYFSVVGSY